MADATMSRRVLLGASAAMLAPEVAEAAESEVLRTAMADKAVPGMAALTIRNLHADREMVAGVRRLGSSQRVRRGDRWHLGSDGKAMTATMIARLVERRALSWTTRLDQLLPQFAETMHADYRDVTLPDLLSHRSGLPENVGGGDLTFFNTFYDDPAPLPQQRLRYIAAGLAEPPAAPKRAAGSYSNTGYVIAGVVAEQATGRAYEDLMRTEVFQPLRLRSVSFNHYGGRGEPVGHVDNRVADQPRDANPPMFTPPGGMRMSMTDWARFATEHMRGERGEGVLLNAESYRFLHAPQGETHSALGWGVQARAAGREGGALVHSGSDGNWYALIALFPDDGAGALVVANAADSMGGDTATLAALRALVATL
ncbi:MAG: serine hydrolase domain-containing protein [Hyphomonadaceae bacterium]